MDSGTLGICASIAGICMGVAPIFQIWQVRRAGNADGVSLGYWVLLCVGFAIWLLYGIASRNPVIVIPYIVSLGFGITTSFVIANARWLSARRGLQDTQSCR